MSWSILFASSAESLWAYAVYDSQKSSESVNILLKVLLVLTIPIHISIYVSGNGFEALYGCFLQITTGGAPILPGLRAWIGLVLVLLPGVWFIFAIQRIPLGNRVRGLAASSIILTLLMGLLVNHASSPIWLLPGSYVDISVVHQIQSLSVAILIVLPLLFRETRALSVSEDLRTMSALDIKQMPSRTLSSNRLLTTLLWCSLVFCPLFGGYLTRIGNAIAIWRLDGLFYSYYILSYPCGYLLTEPGFAISVNALGLPSFIVLALLSSLRLVFLRYVFMYLRGQITKSCLIIVGAMAEILPAVVAAVPGMVSQSVELTMLAFPFPLFVLIAFVFIRLIESHRVRDAIEQGVLEDFEETELIADSPRVPDTITVPVIYVLKSKMKDIARSMRHQSAASCRSRRPAS